jgi:hypothetical protein
MCEDLGVRKYVKFEFIFMATLGRTLFETLGQLAKTTTKIPMYPFELTFATNQIQTMDYYQ